MIAMESVVWNILGRLREWIDDRGIPQGDSEPIDLTYQMRTVGEQKEGWPTQMVFLAYPKAGKTPLVAQPPEPAVEAGPDPVATPPAARAPRVTIETATKYGKLVTNPKLWTIAKYKAALGPAACSALPKNSKKADYMRALAEMVVAEENAAGSPAANPAPAPSTPAPSVADPLATPPRGPTASPLTPPSGAAATAPMPAAPADHAFKFQPEAPPGGKVEDFNFIRVADLSSWGVQRESPYLIRYFAGKKYTPLELYTIALQLSPYDPIYWTARAYLYYQTGHHANALGDLHRAMLLTETVWVAKHRYSQRGLYARVIDAVEAHVGCRVERTSQEERFISEDGKLSGWAGMIREQMRKDVGVPYFLTPLRKVYHHLISLCLLSLQALEDYRAMDKHLPDRLIMNGPDKNRFEDRLRAMTTQIDARTHVRAMDPERYYIHEGRAGWEDHTEGHAVFFDRTKNERMKDRINEQVLNGWPGANRDAPALRVGVECGEDQNAWVPPGGFSNAGLMVVAKRRLAKGEIIYAAEPNLRGHHRPTEEAASAQVTGQLREIDYEINAEREAARRALHGHPTTDLSNAQQQPLNLKETRQASIRGGFRCENCKRGLTVEEVQAARKHMEEYRNLTHDAQLGTCACLYQDPIVPFCTAWHEDWMERSANVPGNSLGAARTHMGGPGGPKRLRNINERTARADNHTLPSFQMKQGLTRGDMPATRVTVFTPKDYGPVKHLFPTAVRQDDRPTRHRRHADDSTASAPDHHLRHMANLSEATPHTCLDIALNTFHYRACGRDWKWLHDAMATYTQIEGDLQATVFSEAHGCQLALLLREAFDVTLAQRDGAFAHSRPPRPFLAPDEIDALMPLLGAEDAVVAGAEDEPNQRSRRWPFSYAANITVPFDILMALGVDVFRDARFDTPHIQAVLRKLHVNAVPWDHRRRDDLVEPEESRGMAPLRKDGLPVLETLYVHTGFALFNHACRGSENATWSWDTREQGVPNRVIVWANKDIPAGDEVRINYWPDNTTSDPNGVESWRDDAEERMFRIFGRGCHCSGCRKWRTLYPNGYGYTADGQPVADPSVQVVPNEED
jgi:hypothetical protein